MGRAEESGLDLVEVAPNAKPPVCRIMDYGKYKYDLKKQTGAKKQKVHTLKEIKFRPNIGQHDLDVKVNRIREFLTEGHKTKVRIFFRGREITHPDRGRELAHGILETLGELATVESNPKLEGKNLVMVLSPAKKKEQQNSDNKQTNNKELSKQAQNKENNKQVENKEENKQTEIKEKVEKDGEN